MNNEKLFAEYRNKCQQDLKNILKEKEQLFHEIYKTQNKINILSTEESKVREQINIASSVAQSHSFLLSPQEFLKHLNSIYSEYSKAINQLSSLKSTFVFLKIQNQILNKQNMDEILIQNILSAAYILGKCNKTFALAGIIEEYYEALLHILQVIKNDNSLNLTCVFWIQLFEHLNDGSEEVKPLIYNFKDMSDAVQFKKYMINIAPKEDLPFFLGEKKTVLRVLEKRILKESR